MGFEEAELKTAEVEGEEEERRGEESTETATRRWEARRFGLAVLVWTVLQNVLEISGPSDGVTPPPAPVTHNTCPRLGERNTNGDASGKNQA